MHAKTQEQAKPQAPGIELKPQPKQVSHLGTLFEKVAPLYTLLLVLWVVALVEWLWAWKVAIPNPVYVTLLAGAMSAYVVARTWSDWTYLAALRNQLNERSSVREFLEGLRGLGYRVFHNLPGDSGDIDHVIISTHGVFNIQVMARRKAVDGDNRIRYDGAAVSLNGGPYDSSVIEFAVSRSRQLQRLLREHTGAELPVKAVLLFPGWAVESAEIQSEADVWVLSPKALPMWIKNTPERIGGREVRQAATELAAYVANYD
ncbi:MAG: nuclease-related domain-containing protein [Woeseia sp.]